MSLETDHADAVEDQEKSSDEEDEHETNASDPEPDPGPIESLVAGRARRAGAGNKYQSLLAVELEKAAEDGLNEDDLALLFEEDEQDIEFDSPVEPESDAEEESSSDEEDKGVAGDAENELEGEAALQKEERAKRRTAKRKADQAFAKPTATRKRVKIDDSIVSSATGQKSVIDRPKKKSERVSWIPTEADAPVRTSSRTLAVQNRQKTLESMQESEQRRMRQLVVMEAAQKRKDAEKVKPMTQAERLAEAAVTERLNSKSLNKWEEMEKDRADKQRARLEALQNRKLEGPVFRWYSGRAEWIDDELVHVGRRPKIEEVKATKEDDDEPGEDTETTITSRIVIEKGKDIDMNDTTLDQSLATNSEQPPSKPEEESGTNDGNALSGLLDGIQDYASLPEDTAGSLKVQITAQTPPADTVMNEPEPEPESKIEPQSELAPTTPIVSAVETEPQDAPTAPADPVPNLPEYSPQPPKEPTNQTTPTPTPPTTTTSTRNLLTLLNFDPTALSEKDIQRRILFAWGPPPTHTSLHITQRKSVNHVPSAYNPQKPVQPVCPITNQPAKYLDPKTGLPYSGLGAFRAIRKCVDGNGGVWSGLLGAWVGGERAAKGVPEGFGRGRGGVVKNEAGV